MILLVHNERKVVDLRFEGSNLLIDFNTSKSIISVLCCVSKNYPNELMIWVKEDYKDKINYSKIKNIFHHKRIMASYSVDGSYSISPRIGYVEQTPYTNVSRHVEYPTWMMSSDVGGIYTSTLNILIPYIEKGNEFDFFLNSVAKLGMPKGLFCYSHSGFMKNLKIVSNTNNTSSIYNVFLFTKQHYKFIWSINLLLCFLFFEKKLPLIPFARTLLRKQLKSNFNLSEVSIGSTRKIIDKKEVDVIIPTIGRKDSLYNVLLDLSIQTLLPKNVIIIEQNPDKNSKSELDYLSLESWPFKIKHKFIHQIGVCNARNLALSFVESEWVLLGDDDNKFENNLIENLFKKIKLIGAKVATTMYIQPNETSEFLITSQTDIFGSGNSMLKTSLLKKVSFDMAFEFGYREDSDFGMQLRKTGNDVIYFPEIKITHLKLPFGGFRTKFTPEWSSDLIQPKPSPTVMVYVKKHYNKFQKRGYKFILFLKFYKKQSIKFPFSYIKNMNKQWEQSEYWSEQLLNKEKNA
jgi:hypothetical protein